MSAPITRGEFKAFERRLIEAIAQMFRDKFAEQDARIEKRLAEQDARIDKRFGEHEADMARGFRAMEQSIIDRMHAMLEPTNDLPPRVAALERAVFSPPPPKRKKRAG